MTSGSLLSAVADPGFSPGGAPTPKIGINFQIFAENCMKMKEFGPGGARPWRPLRSANGEWRIQDFSEGATSGGSNVAPSSPGKFVRCHPSWRVCVPSYEESWIRPWQQLSKKLIIWQDFCRKLHENERRELKSC